MNNALALEKIFALPENEENHLTEFKNILDASTVLSKEICKIAIIGSQSEGKSILINLLAKDNIVSAQSISMPICIAFEQKIKKAADKAEFCKNNNVQNISQAGSFYWTNTQSQMLPSKLSFDRILDLAKNAVGVFIEYSNTAHDIAQKVGLLIPPDLVPGSLSDIRKTQIQILNAVDVADIIVIVATPQELNSEIYDFLYAQKEIIADKPVILFAIHKEITNFFHYPINAECKEALELEKANRDSAKRAYDMILDSYTSDAMSQSLKTGITKDGQGLLHNLENLIKDNFKKTKLHSAYYLPTGEEPSSNEIVEDQNIIADVKDWQFQKIYTGIAQVATSAEGGKLPLIAWEYFFRKSEDICFDTLSPIWQKLKIDMVTDYAKEKILDKVCQTQKEEISILLRDYANSFDEEKLKKLFCEYNAKMLGVLPLPKDKLENIKKMILSLLNETAYCRICGRIQQQYHIAMPTVERIVDEALVVAGGQEDFEQFLSYIREMMFPKQIIEYWEENSPYIKERKVLLEENQRITSNTKNNLLSILDEWINISELVAYKDKIQIIVAKRNELASFIPQEQF